MHKELWNVIKNLASGKGLDNLSTADLALANAQLNSEVFEVVQDHFNESHQKAATPPWV